MDATTQREFPPTDLRSSGHEGSTVALAVKTWPSPNSLPLFLLVGKLLRQALKEGGVGLEADEHGGFFTPEFSVYAWGVENRNAALRLLQRWATEFPLAMPFEIAWFDAAEGIFRTSWPAVHQPFDRLLQRQHSVAAELPTLEIMNMLQAARDRLAASAAEKNFGEGAEEP